MKLLLVILLEESGFLYLRERRIQSHPAGSPSTCKGLQLHVAVLSPVRTPRILNLPVPDVVSRVLQIAGKQHAVIELLERAEIRSNHSIVIVLNAARVNGDAHWLLLKAGVELSLIRRSNVMVGGYFSYAFRTVSIACLVIARIMIVDLFFNRIRHAILKGLVHQPTTAPMVALRFRAVHQLLLGEANRPTKLNHVVRLH